MIFDRSHYWAIAKVLRVVPNDATKYDVILKLCDMFAKDNPKFQPELFLDVAEGELEELQKLW